MTVTRSLRPRPTRGRTLGLTGLALFLVALDSLVVITALPTIRRDLGGSLASLGWTVNAYSLAFAAGIITAAALGDRLGRRRVFVAGLAVFTLGSAASALAPSLPLLIAARAVQGLGGAAVAPLSLTLLASAFPAERRGSIVGLWGGIGGLAIATGPVIGGAVLQGLDWHWIFWVNVPIGLAAIALSPRWLAESVGPATRLDLPAAALVSGGAVGVVYGLVRAGTAGWGDPGALLALGLGLASLVGFVAWERRATEPMLPLRLFGIRSFAAATTTTFLFSAAVFSAAFLGMQYLQVVLGYAPLAAGIHFLPFTATALVVAPPAGALSDRVGQRPIMALGLLLFGIGLGWFAWAAVPHAAYGALIIPLLIAGIGASMAFATTPTAALSAVPSPDLGKASGANATLQRFGGVLGIAVGSAVFTANGHLGAPGSVDAGLRPAIAVAAGLALAGVVSALVVRPRRAVSAAAADGEVAAPLALAG